MTDRKKPGLAFWATVVVVLALVVYPLSFGPACWTAVRGWLPAPAEHALREFYMPIRRLARHGPRPVSQSIAEGGK